MTYAPLFNTLTSIKPKTKLWKVKESHGSYKRLNIFPNTSTEPQNVQFYRQAVMQLHVITESYFNNKWKTWSNSWCFSIHTGYLCKPVVGLWYGQDQRCQKQHIQVSFFEHISDAVLSIQDNCLIFSFSLKYLKSWGRKINNARLKRIFAYLICGLYVIKIRLFFCKL